jgi:hypothetical protein
VRIFLKATGKVDKLFEKGRLALANKLHNLKEDKGGFFSE